MTAAVLLLAIAATPEQEVWPALWAPAAKNTPEVAVAFPSVTADASPAASGDSCSSGQCSASTAMKTAFLQRRRRLFRDLFKRLRHSRRR